MKILGLDYGRRRIGIAVCDPEGICVRGLETIDRRRTPEFIPVIGKHVEEEQPDKLVVGLPLGGDDQETEMSREARAFAAQVHEATGLPLEFVDESFTSTQAQQVMRTRKRSQRHKKSNVDRIAACLIVEAYLRIEDARIPFTHNTDQ